MIVGRGILNGLTPYVDLFESKPPVLYVLSALSLGTSGGPGFAIALQLILLTAIPLLGAIWIVRCAAGQRRLKRVGVALVALATMLLPLEYLLLRSQGFQAESIAGPLTMLFVFAVLFQRAKGARAMVLAAVCAIGAIGTKEPFLLVLAAMAVLLSTSFADLCHRYSAALVVAVVAGCLLLLVAGYWDGYIEMYLPAMLSGRIGTHSAEPLFARPFAVARLLYNTTANYPHAPLLGWLIAGAWLVNPYVRLGGGSRGVLVASVAAMGTGYWLMVKTWVVLTVVSAAHLAGVSLLGLVLHRADRRSRQPGSDLRRGAMVAGPAGRSVGRIVVAAGDAACQWCRRAGRIPPDALCRRHAGLLACCCCMLCSGSPRGNTLFPCS